jgi:predicted Zn-dependent protease
MSKNTELEADKNAIKLLEKYKLNPLCAKKFFEREHNFSDTIMEMMSDHPLNLTRINLLNESAKNI